MILQIVRFKSGLSEEQVLELFKERAQEYRALKGLVQKYYLRFPSTEEYGGVYVWESEKALKDFRESPLGRTFSKVYQVQGEPNVQMADVVLALRRP